MTAPLVITPESSSARGSRRLEARASVVLAVTALLIIVGVIAKVRVLMRWVDGFPIVTPLSSVIVVVMAIALASRSRSRLLLIAGSATGSLLLLFAVVARIAQWTNPPIAWLEFQTGTGFRTWLPPVPTSVGLLGACLGLLLVALGRPRVAQAIATAPITIGTLCVLAFAYGDKAATVAASALPGTATSLPSAVAMLAAATGVLAATFECGFSAWIIVDSPGRRAVRRILPIVLAVPLLLAGVARWTHLEHRLGEARAWAVVMAGVGIGICAVAAAAVGIIDQLAAAAKRAEILDLKLGVAARSEQVAQLATDLAGAVTVEEVSDLVNRAATVPLGAHAASVGMIDRGRGVLAVHHGPDVDADVRATYANPPLDSRLAFTDAARLGEAIFISDAEEYRARYPSTDPIQQRLGKGARAALPLRDQAESTFGSVAFSWDEPVEFDDTLRSTLTTIAALISRSLERARLVDAIREDLERSHDLARFAEVLAGTSSVGDVMEFIAEQVNQTIGATLAFVGTLDESQSMLRRYFPSTFPTRRQTRFALQVLDSPLPLSDAIIDEATILIADRDDLAARYPQGVETYDVGGFVSSAYVPMRGRDGTVVGALGIAWDRSVDFDEGVLAFLRTIGNLAAQTLERVWLIDARLQEARRAGRVAELSQALAATTSEDEVDRIVSSALPALLRAQLAHLGVLDDSGQSLLIGGPVTGTRHAVDGSRPETAAVRHREPVVIVDAAACRRQFPLFADEAWASDAVGYVAHPIIANDGEVLGALGVAWNGPLVLDEGDRAVLSTVLGLISQVLERIRLSEAEHNLVLQLQHRILRPVPTLGIYGIASRYQPASAGVGIGGDWFEGIRLEGGRLALVVGDVVGHGVDAAADMSHLRGVVSLLLRLETPLESLFEAVHDAIEVHTIMATVAVMVFDPTAQRVDYVSAGHPPALLVAADGAIALLEDGRHPLIGGPTRPTVLGRARFGPDSLLVAYTDGLIEARRESIDKGIERLVDAVRETAGLPLEARADELVARCTDGQTARDDIALVLVRGSVETS